jgi:hypothetical protein
MHRGLGELRTEIERSKVETEKGFGAVKGESGSVRAEIDLAFGGRPRCTQLRSARWLRYARVAAK